MFFLMIHVAATCGMYRAALKIVAARLVVRGSFKIVAASIEAKS